MTVATSDEWLAWERRVQEILLAEKFILIRSWRLIWLLLAIAGKPASIGGAWFGPRLAMPVRGRGSLGSLPQLPFDPGCGSA